MKKDELITPFNNEIYCNRCLKRIGGLSGLKENYWWTKELGKICLSCYKKLKEK